MSARTRGIDPRHRLQALLHLYLCSAVPPAVLQYVLATRVDDRRELLPLALPVLTAGLQVRPHADTLA